MEGTMKAARLHGINQPLSIDKIPIPQIGPDEVLLQVKACGICGSDLHMVDGSTKLPSYPTTLGHEFAGIIAEVGDKVEGWQPGDRVCADFLITCGSYFFVPHRPRVHLPKSERLRVTPLRRFRGVC